MRKKNNSEDLKGRFIRAITNLFMSPIDRKVVLAAEGLADFCRMEVTFFDGEKRVYTVVEGNEMPFSKVGKHCLVEFCHPKFGEVLIVTPKGKDDL